MCVTAVSTTDDLLYWWSIILQSTKFTEGLLIKCGSSIAYGGRSVEDSEVDVLTIFAQWEGAQN